MTPYVVLDQYLSDVFGMLVMVPQEHAYLSGWVFATQQVPENSGRSLTSVCDPREQLRTAQNWARTARVVDWVMNLAIRG
jgi:hypothetical protein